jgi:hypothetical protein
MIQRMPASISGIPQKKIINASTMSPTITHLSVSRLRPLDSFLGTLPDTLKALGSGTEYLNID